MSYYRAYYDEAEQFYGVRDNDDTRFPVAQVVFTPATSPYFAVRLLKAKQGDYTWGWAEAVADAIQMAVERVKDLIGVPRFAAVCVVCNGLGCSTCEGEE